MLFSSFLTIIITANHFPHNLYNSRAYSRHKMPAAPRHVIQAALTANMIRGVSLQFCSFPPFSLKCSKSEFDMH